MERNGISLLSFVLLLSLVQIEATDFAHCGQDGKVEITETAFDSTISSFQWMEPDYKTAYVITATNNLYMSKDEGKTWASQLDLLPNGVSQRVSRIYTTPDPSVTYFMSPSTSNALRTIWVTKNQGLSFQQQSSSYAFTELKTHPTRSDWLLGYALSTECINHQSNCHYDLYLSQNYAETWKRISTWVYVYTWGNAGKRSEPAQSIWVLGWSESTNPKTLFNLQLKHSINFFESLVSHSLENVIFMLHYNENFYIAQQHSQSSTINLYVSEDDGYTFVKAIFPFGDNLNNYQYTILDDREGSVFINIRHNTNSNWGNIYTSDALGAQYSLSLEFNRRESDRADFVRVQGINGLYFANQLENIDYFLNPPTSQDAKTRETFDLGGKWDTLAPPIDRNSNPIPCQAVDCGLQLHFQWTNFARIYSNANAVGILLATGNAGRYLENDLNSVKTYLSRDAGWTWMQIRNGSHTFEVTDHGALLVMADRGRETSRIIYSWNEGLSFVECNFATKLPPMMISSIIADPARKSQSFLLRGTVSNTTVYGAIAHVDFSNLHEAQCNDTDYELWTPFDQKGASKWQCILGETISYTRRKQNATCYNGLDYEVSTQPKRCPCSYEDYECDVCFESNGIHCSQMTDCDIDLKQPDDCIDYYYVTQGYRLVANTKCDPYAAGAVNLLPRQVKCVQTTSGSAPVTSGDGSIGAGPIFGIIFAIVFFLAVVFGLLYWRYRRNANASVPTTMHSFEEHNTALDDDLLQGKEAESIDDEALHAAVSKNLTNQPQQDFNPRE